jgi:hypothetical protein
MKNNSRFRAGLFFGIIMAVFNVGWNLAVEDDYTVTTSVVSGLIAGLISGLLFGWLTGIFARSKFVKNTTGIVTKPGEVVVFQTAANHFKGIEAVGGKLYLTNQRLVFKSHRLNIQNHELSIDLTDIISITRHKTAGLIKNGLSITTSQNLTEKFVVEQIDEWVERLSVKSNSQPASTA